MQIANMSHAELAHEANVLRRAIKDKPCGDDATVDDLESLVPLLDALTDVRREQFARADEAAQHFRDQLRIARIKAENARASDET
ncbi:MAG: hypothetical protein IPM54_13425 [Polyangiaceae bacterium]|nr:hypothetical protein [Polyangiaceae bacterium]